MLKRLSRSKALYFVLVAGFILFFTFIVFSFLVHRDFFTQLDFDTTVRLQDRIPERFDDEFSFLSEIGKFEFSSIVLLAILGFYVFGPLRIGGWVKKIFAAFSALISYVSFHVIELYGKFFVNHPPPPQFMLRTEHLFDFPQFHIRSEFSYPSGHAGRAAFLSMILIIFVWRSNFPKAVKTVLILGILAYDILMFVSRVYLGEHWTTDVIGGALLGAALGLMSGGLLFITFKKGVSKPKSANQKKNRG